MKLLTRGNRLFSGILFTSLGVGWLALLATPARAPAQTQPCPTGSDLKWVAPPNLQGGWDLKDSRNGIVLADDFPCTTTGPITDIHIWGSWNNDVHGLITNFWLGIYNDVPAVTNFAAGTVTPSHPGQLLWQQSFPQGQFYENPFAPADELFYNPTNQIFMGSDTQAWYYCFYPYSTNPVSQYGTAAQPTNYWLAARAQLAPDNSLYGWKTSVANYNDAAVWGTVGANGLPLGDWKSMTNNQTLQPINLAFQINTQTNTSQTNCCPEVNGVKWVQWPDVFAGYDINASQGLTLADDFGCTSPGPIADIRLWGSWLNDFLDPGAVFTLTFWSDVPFAPGNPFSHPGTNLWSQSFGPGQYGICLYTNRLEDFFTPLPTGGLNLLGNSSNLYYLCFTLDPANTFTQRGTVTAPTNYWLSVNVQSAAGSQLDFGWKTSATNYNDTAVWGNGLVPGSWTPMYDPVTSGKPVNMAFKITTATNSCYTWVCPTKKTVPCGASWGFDPPIIGPDSCCPVSAYVISTNIVTISNTPCLQAYKATFTITDCTGVSNYCSQTVTVLDANPPTLLNCGSNMTVECGTAWTFKQPTAQYVCSGSNVFVGILSSNVAVGTGPCSSVYTVVWSATNQCSGASSTCSQTVTVVDTTPPVLTCATNKTVLAGTPWTFDPPTAYDLCCGTNLTVFVVNTSTNGTGCNQVASRSWQAVDCCQNFSTICTQVVTVTCPTTGCVVTNGIKYVQWPNTNQGFDVWNSSTIPPNAPDGPWLLADDFICTNTGYITDIHLWGSWWYDQITNNITFWLGLFEDVQTNANNPYSHPGNLFWSQCFAPGQYSESFWSPALETFLDPGLPNILGSDSQVWYYCFYPTIPPIQKGRPFAPKTYWLGVYAQLPPGTPNFFGWKTTTNVQHDISAHAKWNFGFCPTNLPETGFSWQPTRDVTGLPLDLAFEITTSTNCSSTLITIDYFLTNKVVLSWPRGVLQVSTNVLGTYVDVPGATSPYTNFSLPMPPTNRFYRVRCGTP